MQHMCSVDMEQFTAVACCRITTLLSLGRETMWIYDLLEFFVLVIFSCQVIFSAKLFQIMSRTGEAELKLRS